MKSDKEKHAQLKHVRLGSAGLALTSITQKSDKRRLTRGHEEDPLGRWQKAWWRLRFEGVLGRLADPWETFRGTCRVVLRLSNFGNLYDNKIKAYLGQSWMCRGCVVHVSYEIQLACDGKGFRVVEKEKSKNVVTAHSTDINAATNTGDKYMTEQYSFTPERNLWGGGVNFSFGKRRKLHAAEERFCRRGTLSGKPSHPGKVPWLQNRGITRVAKVCKEAKHYASSQRTSLTEARDDSIAK
ncbi:hypothetical protein Bbelb_092940 [Branchiostoma belcheri]|nr:hypothetical protein Bbelb_092940 [Branchiostoma belcheri]